MCLVYFENGAGVGAASVDHCMTRVKDAYGQWVEIVGRVSISGIWREFFLPYVNLTPSEVAKRWGELPVAQFNCLTCRTAMYVWAVAWCEKAGVTVVADGARRSQGWPIMQESMLARFRDLFAAHSLELRLPVYDLDSDWSRKNLLLMRGFVPKTLEPQCLVGVPLPYDGAPPPDVQQAVESYYDDVVLPRAREILRTQKEALVDGRRERAEV